MLNKRKVTEEDLKCCGNCKHFICLTYPECLKETNNDVLPSWVCQEWEFDDLHREDRNIESVLDTEDSFVETNERKKIKVNAKNVKVLQPLAKEE